MPTKLPKVEGTIQLRGKYHAKIRVPKPIRAQWNGKETHQESLRTSDPKTAADRVGTIVAIMNAQLEKARVECPH